MLYQTFRHIPGIGHQTEKKLWNAGISSWDDFDQKKDQLALRMNKQTVADYLEQSRKHIAQNPGFFADRLKAKHLWRLFPHYRHSIAYLDIETTGLNCGYDHITSIALYDGSSINCYVYGQNLDDFVSDIASYQVIVTYNGKTFDIPFIERYFNMTLDCAHIDLRYILRSLGIQGGLKKCEKYFGIDRGELEGVDGYMAILLWEEYKNSANEKALETLLAYNIEDVVNLEQLLVLAYNSNISKTPFANSAIELPIRPKIRFSANSELVSALNKKMPMSMYFNKRTR